MITEKRDVKTWQPVPVNASELQGLIKMHAEIQIVDQYNGLLEELFLLRNPQYRFNKNYQDDFTKFVKANRNLSAPDEDGQWFYFPWSNTLVHYLPENEHLELRTGRNKNLITKEEQEKYYNSCVAILGLSVGSHVAVTLAMTGGAKRIKLADPDKLSGDNLNRIRTGYHEVGLSKAIAVARRIYEMNPYAMIELYPEGVTEENMETILGNSTKPDVIVEEMDNLPLKFKIRELARPLGIPFVMGTDNGDGITVDIERFDLDTNYPILHGLPGDLTSEKLKTISPQELPRYTAKIAGADIAPVRMLASVSEVGKTLYSWPQLGTSANMCGSAVTYLVRRIILKAPEIASGRYPIDFDATFESDWTKKEVKRESERQEIFKKMRI